MRTSFLSVFAVIAPSRRRERSEWGSCYSVYCESVSYPFIVLDGERIHLSESCRMPCRSTPQLCDLSVLSGPDRVRKNRVIPGRGEDAVSIRKEGRSITAS